MKGNGKRQPEIAVQIEKTKASGYTLVVAARWLKLKRTRSSQLYWLCDQARTLPVKVNCDGVEVPLKLVIKVYAKLSQKDLVKRRQDARYKSLLRGQAVFTP